MQLTEIIAKTEKIETFEVLLQNMELILDLAKQDVAQIARSKGIVFVDFDFVYACATEMLKNQLKKQHLRGVERFFKTKNISEAIAWIISRILNNARNITTNENFKLYFKPINVEFDENIYFYENYENVLAELELEKTDKTVIKQGLCKIWKNSIFYEDFDYCDMELLCEKFGIDVNEIVNVSIENLQKFSKEATGSGNSQLVFVF